MLHYEERQSNGREIILFIHGLGTSSWMWWQQEKAFADYQIILVDLPGHGKSAATPWINLTDTTNQIARDVIQNRTVHVVGLSLGGHVALELVKRYPENIHSAFISGITVKPLRYGSFLKVQSWLVERMKADDDKMAKLALEQYKLPLEKLESFKTNYRLLTQSTYETIMKDIIPFELDESYATISKPCLIVAGDQESSNITQSIEIATKVIPHSAGTLIPNGKHAWPVEMPAEFNRVLREWLSRFAP